LIAGMLDRSTSESADGVGIHQILASASEGDAITNLALATRDLLRKVGPSEIYARHVPPEMEDDIREIVDYNHRHSRNVLIVHASIGQAEVHEFLLSRKEPLVLVYHNITPASFYEDLDPFFADLLSIGRHEIEVLRSRVVVAMADSHYNARELEAMGYEDVRVVPPVVHLHRFDGIEPNPATLEALGQIDAPWLLSVGQLLPHKRPDYLIQMMHLAETYQGAGARLLLVGHQRLEKYANAIREQVRELNLDKVHLIGPVPDADLVAYFQASSAVVTASEHEGFCLPLLEAMSMDKPIIARSFAAIPETVGDAALLLPPHVGPTFYAEAMTELMANRPLQEHLVARGRARIAELGARTPDTAILETLLQVV
jgi:glycosyltransferase involved in cell wall biosynthesis